jgi:hypothetical protein
LVEFRAYYFLIGATISNIMPTGNILGIYPFAEQLAATDGWHSFSRLSSKTIIMETNLNEISETGTGRKVLKYGGLALLSLYALRKVPFLRTLAVPVIASMAIKHFRHRKEATA